MNTHNLLSPFVALAKKGSFSLALAVLLSSCTEYSKIIVVNNDLNLERTTETIELTKEFLKVEDLSYIGIRDMGNRELQLTQLVDLDGDGIWDQLLFQPQMVANTDKSYSIEIILDTDRPKTDNLCFSRFVPERTDDYTWENDKVAFRVYGPTAQKIKESGEKGGTLSSGVDAWLKRVEYPIINKWYKEHFDKVSSYHEDTGEGCDNFHVGVSRGVGGIAVKGDSTYYVSKNYTKWRTITTGPIRTSFYLEYADWDANGKTVTESKVIALDLGSRLSKFELNLGGVDEVSVGLTLNNLQDSVKHTISGNSISLWYTQVDSKFGTAIVAKSAVLIDHEDYATPVKDESNFYAHLKVTDDKLTYYAGFGWKKAGEITTSKEWEQYLKEFSQKIESKLTVTLKSNNE
ncbi:MAG: DUF4861 family protein [Flavobacteriales bacterium]|nr:DUF4861 family protein [Flavobacteriales bacterium]